MNIEVDRSDDLYFKVAGSQTMEIRVFNGYIHRASVFISRDQAVAISDFLEKHSVASEHAESGMELK
jgi:hypothetical protein